MAELTEETVQKLNQILGRMAGGESQGARTPEQMAADRSGMSNQQKMRSLRAQLEITDKTTEAYRNLDDELAALVETEKKAATAQAALKKEFDAGAQAADNLTSRLIGINGEFQSLTSVIPMSGKELVGFTKQLVSFNGIMRLTGGLLLKVVSNTVNFALQTDKAAASFRAATGAGYEYSNVISQAGTAFLTYDINAEDAAAATFDLFSSFRDFTTLSESQQASIVATTAIMSKFGVSGQETASNLDVATKALGLNVIEAETLIRDFESIAKSVGKPISEISSDFASAAPKLAFYGTQAVDVFKQLEAQSKSTGLSVDQLIGTFGEQFDTFEGSAQAVGRLNAIMGGPFLNSIDMLNATEDQRLEMVREAIKAQGVLFEDMNKFERLALARAMGTDVETLARSLKELSPFEQRQIKRQEDLAEKAGKARDILTKLTDAFNSLIVANQDLVQKLVDGIDTFSKFIQKNHDLGKLLERGEKRFNGLKDSVKSLAIAFAAFKTASLVVEIAKAIAAYQALAVAKASAAGGVGGAGRFARGAGRFLKAGGIAAAGYGAAKLASGAGYDKTAMGIGVGSGAISGAMMGAGFGLPGMLIGGALGAGVGYLGSFNDTALLLQEGEAPTAIGLNSSDKVAAVVGTPTGPVAQAGLFGGGAGGSGNLDAIRVAVAQGIADGMANATIATEVKLEGDAAGILKVANTPAGKRAYMPFYNR